MSVIDVGLTGALSTYGHAQQFQIKDFHQRLINGGSNPQVVWDAV
jgi:hypothetical protein